jgi:hypothetical protein
MALSVELTTGRLFILSYGLSNDRFKAILRGGRRGSFIDQIGLNIGNVEKRGDFTVIETGRS